MQSDTDSPPPITTPETLVMDRLRTEFEIEAAEVDDLLSLPPKVARTLNQTRRGRFVARAELLSSLRAAQARRPFPKRSAFVRAQRLCGAFLHADAMRRVIDGAMLHEILNWMPRADYLAVLSYDGPSGGEAPFDCESAAADGAGAFQIWLADHPVALRCLSLAVQSTTATASVDAIAAVEATLAHLDRQSEREAA